MAQHQTTAFLLEVIWFFPVTNRKKMGWGVTTKHNMIEMNHMSLNETYLTSK